MEGPVEHRMLGFGVRGPPGHPCCGWLPPRTPAWLTICWLLHMTSPLSCPPWLREKTSGRRGRREEAHQWEILWGKEEIKPYFYLFTTATPIRVTKWGHKQRSGLHWGGGGGAQKCPIWSFSTAAILARQTWRSQCKFSGWTESLCCSWA